MSKDIYNKIHQIALKGRVNAKFYKNRLLEKDYFDNYSLKNIYFHIINKCNLNCAYCDNFSPLSMDNWYISPYNFENIIKQLKKFFNNIEFLNIGGGEPLLHPQLIDLCCILRQYYPYSAISVLSNGILLDKYDKKLIDEITKMNIVLVISQYPISINYNRQTVIYNKNKYIYTIQNRYKMFNLQISQYKKKDNHVYDNCDYAGFIDYKKATPRCIQLDNKGNLFFCGIVANIHLFEKYFGIYFEKIKGKYGDYINIFETNDIDDILYGINNKIPFCDYCNQPKIVDWKISKRELCEWCIDEKI